MKFKIPSWCGHLLTIGAIILLFYPTAKAYVFSGEPSGGDLHNLLTYLEHFRQHLTFPPSSWQPFWYSGVATFRSYPWLHIYLMQPLVHLSDSFWAVEIYSLAAMFLFFLFSYLLFFYLCRNHLFSLFLTSALFFTRGSFLGLFRTGFIGAAATQFFFPLSVLLALFYLEKNDTRFLLASAVAVGLAILGHPLIGIFFAFLPCLTTLLLNRRGRFSILEKIKTAFSFCLVTISIAGIIVYPLAELYLATAESRTCSDCSWDIAQLVALFNPLMFAVFVILLLVGGPLLFSRKDKREDNHLLIFSVVLVEFLIIFASVTFNLNLVPLVAGSLWPERMVWAISVVLAAISAILTRQILAIFENKQVFGIGFNVAALVVLAGLFFSQPREIFSSLHAPPGVYPREAAFTFGKYERLEPKSLVPSWLDTADFNHRFDDLNYVVNHWWNVVFTIPNTRGYGQFTKGIAHDWSAWLWVAETGDLEMDREAAQNTALFLLDWYAIAYFEDSGRFFGPDRSTYADYLVGPDIIEKKEQIAPLTFYKLRPELTSPIVAATNAPTVLVVGSKVAYDAFGRALALANTNSTKLIPIRGPLRLEKLVKMRLTDFDAIFLYGYEYDDRVEAWKSLEDYVKNGGKVFIETGIEVRESDIKSLPEGVSGLPEIFPIDQTRRAGLGKEWEVGLAKHPVNSAVDPARFAPLLYQNDPWKISFVPSRSLVREGAKVILTQAGRPVLVENSLGQGTIIWSGLNLPYHITNYNNPEEAKLLENILLYLMSEAENLPTQSISRPKPETVIVSGDNLSGLLFKETHDDGWKAKVNGAGVKIYSAGPDFMYVRVPGGIEDKIKIEFFYRGSTIAWILFLVSFGTVSYSCCYIITGRNFMLRNRLIEKLRRDFTRWWEEENEIE